MTASPEHEELRRSVALEEGIPAAWAEEVRGRTEEELRASAQGLRRKGLDHAGAGYPTFEAALVGMQREQAARNGRMRWA